MKQKTADELFEELGYKKCLDDERFIKYRRPYDNDYIIIDKVAKDFLKNFDFAYWKPVNMQELQAINKKCEELGWIGAIFVICGVIGALVTIAVMAFEINIFLGFLISFIEISLLGGILLDIESC